MKRTFLKALFVSFLLAVLSACSFSDARDDEAAQLIEAYVNAVNNQDYDTALGMVSEEFLMERGREGWIEHYKNVHEVLGKVTNLKLKQKISDARYSARFYMYQYANKYENGLAKELITVVQMINNDEPLKIGGHKIESSKLPGAPK